MSLSFSHIVMSELGIPTKNCLNSAGFLFASQLLLGPLKMRCFLMEWPLEVPSPFPV